MEIEGKITHDLPVQEGTSAAGKVWRKKGWVLETFGNYPSPVYFTAFNDRINNLHLEVGKSYRVSIDLRSREYNGRWYTDVSAYNAMEIGQATAAPENPAQQQVFGTQNFGGAFPQQPVQGGGLPPITSDSSDDLPF